jgi:hypothetical protein
MSLVATKEGLDCVQIFNPAPPGKLVEEEAKQLEK